MRTNKYTINKNVSLTPVKSYKGKEDGLCFMFHTAFMLVIHRHILRDYIKRMWSQRTLSIYFYTNMKNNVKCLR